MIWENCNLMHFRYFCSAVKLGSLSASARHWRVGQSAISQAIRRLEEICGASLLHHHQGRFETTALGRLFYEHAMRVTDTVDAMAQAIENSQKKQNSIVNLGCSHSVALGLITPALGDGRALGLQVSMQIAAPDQIRRWLQQGIIDSAIVVEEPTDSSFVACTIHNGCFGLYQAQIIQSGYENRILVSQHANEADWLMKQMGSHLDLQWMRIRSWEVSADMAQQGQGLAFLPDYVTFGPERLLKICNRYKLPKFEYKLVLLVRDLPTTPAMQAMGVWLRDYLTHITRSSSI